MTKLTDAETEALHAEMAPWAKVMPYMHLGPEHGLSDGIWTRLDRAVNRILADRAALSAEPTTPEPFPCRLSAAEWTGYHIGERRCLTHNKWTIRDECAGDLS